MKRVIPFILIVVLAACSKTTEETRCNNFTPAQPTITDMDQYKIWSDILPEKGQAPYIIQQKSYGLDSISIYQLQNDSLTMGFKVDSALLAAFINANTTDENWGNQFIIPSQIITYDEANCLFSNGVESGWTDYYNKYPTGYWSISKVGLYGDAALVNFSYVCGSLCAEGAYLLLKKVNGKWTIEKQGITWVA
jgi:hypothetical protein